MANLQDSDREAIERLLVLPKALLAPRAVNAVYVALKRAREACAGTQCEACRKGYKYENGFHVGNGEWTRCKAVTIRGLTIAELLEEG